MNILNLVLYSKCFYTPARFSPRIDGICGIDSFAFLNKKVTFLSVSPEIQIQFESQNDHEILEEAKSCCYYTI